MLTEMTTTTTQDPGAEPKARVWIDPPQSVEQLMLAALLRIEKLLTPEDEPAYTGPPLQDLIKSIEPTSTPLIELTGKRGRKSK